MVTNPKFGNGNSVDFAGTNPNIVADTGTGTQSGGYSTDNGVTWKPFASQAGGSKIAVGADGSVIVWGTNYSTDNGASWKACTGLSGSPRIASIGSTRKSFMRSPTEPCTPAATAQRHSPRPPPGCRAAGGRQQFLEWKGSLGGGGKQSVPLEELGRERDQDHGSFKVYSVGFGKAATGASYPAAYIIGTVGSVSGVFRSTDQGVTWLRVNDDQHQYGQMTMWRAMKTTMAVYS